MKTRGISCLAAIAILLTLTACAGPEITQMDVELEKARVQTERQEAADKLATDKAEYELLAKLSPEVAAAAYSNKQMREMAVAFINRDQKRSMNFYDAKAAIAAQQNALIDKTTGRVLKASVVGGAIWAANDLAQHGMDKAGDKVTMTGDNNATEINRVDAKSKTATSQIGDANATGPSDAVASGPDKSSTVTEVVAPEEPKVEEPEVEEEEEGEFEPTEPPDFDDEPIDIPEVPAE